MNRTVVSLFTFFVAFTPPLLRPAQAFAQAQAPAPGQVACPADLSGDTIEDWRDTAIKSVIAGQTTQVGGALTRCFPSGVPRCMDDLAYYNQTRGGGVSNSPRANQDRGAMTISSAQDLPAELRAEDGTVKIPPNILEVAKQKGWKAANYKTRSTGGFDQAPDLTLIAVPGATKDIFLQISPKPNPEDATDPSPNPHSDPSNGQATLTIITVDKSRRPPLGQLRRMGQNGNGTYQWSNNLRVDGCLGCHASPLRSISPRGHKVANAGEDRMTPEQENNIDEINNMMIVPEIQWGTTTGPDGAEQRLGPAMDSQPTGWAPPGSETRKEAFIKDCAQNAPNIGYAGFGNYTFQANPSGAPGARNVNWQNVKEAMNCVNCHNGKIRGYLTSNFSPDEIHFKVLVDRSMPFASNNLNMDERLAVVECLRRERVAVADRWRQSGAWMKNTGCDDFNPAANGSTGPSGVVH